MRCVVVGYGVQGRKRAALAGSDLVGIVDPVAADVTWRRLEDAPLDSYDAALVCTPDGAKQALLEHLLSHGKHVLVEKPLLMDPAQHRRLADAAARSGALCYTAYNHRFEPHVARLKAILSEGWLGRLYQCRLFYGNGTARDVRLSAWRDQGAGVLPDLGSHLLDLMRWWFGSSLGKIDLIQAHCHENRSFDHVSFMAAGDAQGGAPVVEAEMTLLSWRNHFRVELLAEHGSVHIESLCKWGPSSLTVRRRKLPSGRPDEEAVTLVQPDPTWALEYDWFKRRVAAGRAPVDAPADVEDHLANDRAISEILAGLAAASGRSLGAHHG